MFASLKMIIQMVSRSQFDHFLGYLSHMDERFARDQTEFNAKFEAETKDFSKAERSQLAEWCGDDDWYISEVFPRMFAQSALTMVWSHFEHEMVAVCRMDILHETESLGEGEKNADKCKTLAHVETYLKGRGVPLLPTWTELNGNIREVRNQIVHDNGRRYGTGPGAPDDDAAIKTMERSKRVDKYVEDRLAAGKIGISFESDQLVVTTKFCREIADMCEELVTNVIENMPETIESYGRVEALMARDKKRRADRDAKKKLPHPY